MGDDHPPAGDLGRDLAQALGDILVGQAVKSVTPNALGIEADAELRNDRRVGAWPR